jgi:hypothetical protein
MVKLKDHQVSTAALFYRVNNVSTQEGLKKKNPYAINDRDLK